MRLLTGLVAILFSVSAFAQTKAKIYIKKSENGKVSEETHEVDIKEGQDIETILREMGILDEFGQLKEGQSFSINIDKFEGDDNQNINMLVMPPMPPMPPLPPDAPNAPEWFPENMPFLGVMLKENNDEVNDSGNAPGVLISEVIEGTAAETAGLLAGDIILSFNDVEISDVEQAVDYIQAQEPGDKIKIELLRENKKKKINAELGERTEDIAVFPYNFEIPEIPDMESFDFKFDDDSIMILCPPNPNCICPNDSMKICMPFSWSGEGFEEKETSFLGVTPTAENTQNGVKIHVVEGSSAEKMGIEDNDIIVSFNQNPVNNFDQLAEYITTTNPGELVTIGVMRNGKSEEFSGEIGKKSYSSCEDIRIFKDFKGMDEEGSYFFDYEFDMDQENIELQMQELLERLEIQQDALREELGRLQENRLSVQIEINISEITDDEAAAVNQNAATKLKTTNDLVLDRISFFPNPGNGLINLAFQTVDSGDLKILVYDSRGNIVYLEENSQFNGNYDNVIDITNQSNGSYYLQIMQNGKTYSKKIVKG